MKTKDIILVSIIIILMIALVFNTFIGLKNRIIYDGVKEKFGEFVIYQAKTLNYCIQSNNLNQAEFFNDFLRNQTEGLINEGI